MESERAIVNGIVKNGVVMPECSDVELPEGLCVEILMPEISPELRAEFDAWETASDADFAAFEQYQSNGRKKCKSLFSSPDF